MASNKILLFGTETSMTHLITSCLQEAGYLVTCKHHGIGALDLIHTEKPAVIILTNNLPGMNSLAIIRALRSGEFKSRVPVILLGENLQEEDVLMGLEVGADLCLQEAFHPQVFVARVRSLIRRREPAKQF